MTQFILILDVAIVNVALPTIQVDLGFSQKNLQWVVSAYVLGQAGASPGASSRARRTSSSVSSESEGGQSMRTKS